MMRRQSGGRPFRVSRTGLLAAFVTFLMLATSGAAYAYWSAQATLTSTAKAGLISISLANVSSMQNTFVNDTRSNTGSVTVTNTTVSTSTTPISTAINLGIVAGGSTVLASNLDVTVWGPTTAASCTSGAAPSGTVTTGTWASFPTVNSTLTAGQAKTWCIRTSNDERSELASSSGTLTIQPKVTAALTAGTWSATASATTTQNTQYIYPVAPIASTTWFRIHLTTNSSRCLDIKASGNAGTELIDWPCHTNPNQQFQLSGADANGYLAVTPRHAQTLRWDNGGSTTPGSGIKIQSSTGTGSQGWQFQQVSAGVYQVVNKASGLCIQPGAKLSTGETAYYQALCSGAASQRFTLDVVQVVLNVACTENGDSKSDADLTFSWGAVDAGSYTFQANNPILGIANWQTIGTSGAHATSATVDGTQPVLLPLEDWAQKTTYDVRMLDSSGNLVTTSSPLSIYLGKKQDLSCG